MYLTDSKRESEVVEIAGEQSQASGKSTSFCPSSAPFVPAKTLTTPPPLHLPSPLCCSPPRTPLDKG